MLELDVRKERIIDEERYLATQIASSVVTKPVLSVWMILIPIIFVYYFFQFSRFTKGKKRFVDDYLITFQRALEAASDVIESGDPPDHERLRERFSVPEIAGKEQNALFRFLLDHYLMLLKTGEDHYNEMFKKSYSAKELAFEFLERLIRSEKKLSEALKKNLDQPDAILDDVIDQITKTSRAIRRERIEEIYAT